MSWETGEPEDRSLHLHDRSGEHQRYLGLMEDPKDAELVTTLVNRFWDGFQIPGIGQYWRGPEWNGDGEIEVIIQDVQRSGKYLCQRATGGPGVTTLSAVELNLNWKKIDG